MLHSCYSFYQFLEKKRKRWKTLANSQFSIHSNFPFLSPVLSYFEKPFDFYTLPHRKRSSLEALVLRSFPNPTRSQSKDSCPFCTVYRIDHDRRKHLFAVRKSWGHFVVVGLSVVHLYSLLWRTMFPFPFFSSRICGPTQGAIVHRLYRGIEVVSLTRVYGYRKLVT